MSTTTSNLGLVKPDPTELYSILVPNANMDRIDLVRTLFFCTSGTRPNTPFSGMGIYETDTGNTYVWVPGSPGAWTAFGSIVCTSSTRPAAALMDTIIYETDTQRLYYWNGSAWTAMLTASQIGQVLGGKRYTTTAAIGSITTTETAIYDTGSIALVNGQAYELEALVEYQNSAAVDVVLKIRDTNATGTILAQATVTPKGAATSSLAYLKVPYVASATGAKTFVVTAIRASGTGTVTGRGNSASPPFAQVKLAALTNPWTSV